MEIRKHHAAAIHPPPLTHYAFPHLSPPPLPPTVPYEDFPPDLFSSPSGCATWKPMCIAFFLSSPSNPSKSSSRAPWSCPAALRTPISWSARRFSAWIIAVSAQQSELHLEGTLLLDSADGIPENHEHNQRSQIASFEFSVPTWTAIHLFVSFNIKW